MVRLCSLILLFFISLPAFSAKNAQVYLNMDEQWQPYTGQFKQVLSESFKRLQT